LTHTVVAGAYYNSRWNRRLYEIGDYNCILYIVQSPTFSATITITAADWRSHVMSTRL